MKKKLLQFVVATFAMTLMVISSVGPADAGPLGYRTLSYGSSGWEVANLQKSLNNLGYNAGTTDGKLGKNTWKAVTNFQRNQGLVADGVVGTRTRQAIEAADARRLRQGATSTSSRGNKFTREDLTWLARAVYSEARGESYIGQVAVAAVVLNRLEHPDFPKTIKGIIFEPWAFTAVNDGQIWMTPSDSAYKAAQDAMNGWDPTNGAIYYYNPAKTTNKWIWSRPVVKTIGDHVFAK